jgi:hypothetical protein
MINLMELYKHERFRAANQELWEFLRRVEALASRSGTVTETELKTILDRMLNLAPEVGDASRSETLDGNLLSGIQEYVQNFRALQQAIEKIRCVILGHPLHLEICKTPSRFPGRLGAGSPVDHPQNQATHPASTLSHFPDVTRAGESDLIEATRG